MVSVLIPTYNYDVTKLVKQLHRLLCKLGIDFEIKVFDDGSKSELNKKLLDLNKLEKVQFKELPENVGLSQNRNLLVQASKFNHLILLDADSQLKNDSFIKNYIKAFKKDPDIIYGGLTHPKKIKPEQKLRWKYGKNREEVAVEERMKRPYKFMRSNNLALNKRIFNAISYDSSITKYGHEDTLFAYQASLKNLDVIHIDNPVVHGDIDIYSTFLNKTKSSLENLNYIYKNQLIDKDFIPFLFYFSRMKRFGINYLLSFFFKVFNPILTHQLKSRNPSLKIFDLYRLSYFCYINLRQ